MKEGRHLAWKSHHSTLIGVFSSLLGNQTLVDAILTIENESIQAHRLVLCACSPYFQEILTVQQELRPGPAVVYLSGYSMDDVKAIIRYMYCGEILVPVNQMRSFLLTAKALQIRGLTKDLPPVSPGPFPNIPIITTSPKDDIVPMSPFSETDPNIPHISIPLALSSLPGISSFDKRPPVATVVAKQRHHLLTANTVETADMDHFIFSSSHMQHSTRAGSLSTSKRSTGSVINSVLDGESSSSQPKNLMMTGDGGHFVQNNAQIVTMGYVSESETNQLESGENAVNPLEEDENSSEPKVEHIEVSPEILHVWNYPSHEDPSTEQPIIAPKRTARPYCPKCGKRTSDLIAHFQVCEVLRKSQGERSKGVKKMCNYCGVWVVNMSRHLGTVHKNSHSNPAARRTVQRKPCPNCGTQVGNLTKHLKSCQIAATFTEDNYGVHLLAAALPPKKPTRKFICPRCGVGVTKIKRHLVSCKGPSSNAKMRQPAATKAKTKKSPRPTSSLASKN